LHVLKIKRADLHPTKPSFYITHQFKKNEAFSWNCKNSIWASCQLAIIMNSMAQTAPRSLQVILPVIELPTFMGTRRLITFYM
jgi:hypothetical protein